MWDVEVRQVVAWSSIVRFAERSSDATAQCDPLLANHFSIFRGPDPMPDYVILDLWWTNWKWSVLLFLSPVLLRFPLPILIPPTAPFSLLIIPIIDSMWS
jgi:hypothetical protein